MTPSVPDETRDAHEELLAQLRDRARGQLRPTQAHALQLRINPRHPRQRRLARAGQADPARGPVQQARAQSGLDLGQDAALGGLGLGIDQGQTTGGIDHRGGMGVAVGIHPADHHRIT